MFKKPLQIFSSGRTVNQFWPAISIPCNAMLSGRPELDYKEHITPTTKNNIRNTSLTFYTIQMYENGSLILLSSYRYSNNDLS